MTLVSPHAHAVYSGMVPGTLAGHYTLADGSIDVAALAARAGAAFLPDRIVGIDHERRVVRTAERGEIPYDLLSLDVGSRPRGIDAVRANPLVVGAKPVEEAAPRIARFLEETRARGRGAVAVVGAGAGGIEVAFALRQSLGEAGQVTVIEAGADVLPAGSRRMRALVGRLLSEYGIRVRTGVRFQSLSGGAVFLDDASSVPADLVVWATGAEGLPLLRESGLPVDSEGFLWVGQDLRSPNAPEVFAAGDCARMESHPNLPRAGVYAVRQGPILEENLRRALRGKRLLNYHPQSDFLSLVSTGDGRAAASWRGFAFHGRAWWRLKDWIDRGFIAKYAPPSPSRLRTGPEVAATMPMDPCGGCAAKVDPDLLARTLRGLSIGSHGDVTLGLESPDDAAILHAPTDGRLVFTVDAFPPFASDPLLVGEVAALNALSDVYAMGGRPTAVLAIVGVSSRDGATRESDLRLWMEGAERTLSRLGVALAGGHSIETESPLIGFAVLGAVRQEDVLQKSGVSSGDRIVLTKPLGTGVVLAATRAGECPPDWTNAAVASMREANDVAARVLVETKVRSVTDVSGFGLAGHLAEMLRASRVAATLWADSIPSLAGARELLARDWRSSADEHLSPALERTMRRIDIAHDDPVVALVRDPQTSGGLLAAVPERSLPNVERALEAAGVSCWTIGVAEEGPPGEVRLQRSPTGDRPVD